MKFDCSTPKELIEKVKNLDLKIILINNGHHGMVRQWQTLFFDKNFQLNSFRFFLSISNIIL